jgi:hypothetical protein
MLPGQWGLGGHQSAKRLKCIPLFGAPLAHKGRREEPYHAASMRRNRFHIAVAAPEVSTGKIRAS